MQATIERLNVYQKVRTRLLSKADTNIKCGNFYIPREEYTKPNEVKGLESWRNLHPQKEYGQWYCIKCGRCRYHAYYKLKWCLPDEEAKILYYIGLRPDTEVYTDREEAIERNRCSNEGQCIPMQTY